ncbi:MAG: hypothetical protein ABID09_02795 [Candidatus Omnitrophota bacterium]
MNEKEHKKYAVYLFRKYTGKTLQEISDQFLNKKLSASAINKIATRMEKERGKNKILNNQLEKIEDRMSNVEV